MILTKYKSNSFLLLVVLLFIFINPAFTQLDGEQNKTTSNPALEDEISPDILNSDALNFGRNKDSSDVTIKIYKSTDQSNELLDGNINVDTQFSDDVISKEELLGIKNRGRLKTNRESYKNTNVKYVSANQIIMPWILLSISLLIIFLIFKLLRDNKL